MVSIEELLQPDKAPLLGVAFVVLAIAVGTIYFASNRKPKQLQLSERFQREGGKQIYVLCMMEAFISSMGTFVPSSTIPVVSHCSSEFEIERCNKSCSKEAPGDAYGQVMDQTMNLFISEDVNQKNDRELGASSLDIVVDGHEEEENKLPKQLHTAVTSDLCTTLYLKEDSEHRIVT